MCGAQTSAHARRLPTSDHGSRNRVRSSGTAREVTDHNSRNRVHSSNVTTREVTDRGNVYRDLCYHTSALSGRVEEDVVFRYTAPGGGRVRVPRYIRPHQVLQVAQDASRGTIKQAFRRLANQDQRQQRVMASLSYSILLSKMQRYHSTGDGSFEITEKCDVIVLATAGDTANLLAEISRNKSLLACTDEHKHTLLYLTARSGFYDTSDALLKLGVSVNDKEVDGSTPLHAASFYGQRLIVELLLRYGADPTIRNKWGNTPADEATSDEIKTVILERKKDIISQITSSLMKKGLAHRVYIIECEGKVIGKEVFRCPDALDQRTRLKLESITANWLTVWHGTKSKHLESIFRHGLMPSGTKLANGFTIKPPSNHYKLGEKHFDIDNWANAIFLSPSIAYASHNCYSERIFSSSEHWCILIKAYVEPTAYTMHDTTTFKYDRIDGEPETPEYRIEVTSEDKIMRVESARNVVVTSIMFISLHFLENTANLTFDKLKSLFDIKHHYEDA